MKYPDGVKIDASEFPADWFEGLRDDQVDLLSYPKITVWIIIKMACLT